MKKASTREVYCKLAIRYSNRMWGSHLDTAKYLVHFCGTYQRSWENAEIRQYVLKFLLTVHIEGKQMQDAEHVLHVLKQFRSIRRLLYSQTKEARKYLCSEDQLWLFEKYYRVFRNAKCLCNKECTWPTWIIKRSGLYRPPSKYLSAR